MASNHCTDACDDPCQIDHVAVYNMHMDNTVIELDEFAYKLFVAFSERINSTGIPLGDKITSKSFFIFNTDMLIKYPPT